MDDEFIAIPARFINSIMQNLHGAEMKVLLLLFAIGAHHGPVEITMAALSEATGISRRAISDAVAAERRDHIVRMRAKAGSHVYAYRIREADAGPPQSPVSAAPAQASVATEGEEPKKTVASELDRLLLNVAPMVNMDGLREFASNDDDLSRLLACLRAFHAKGRSYAEANLFLTAVSHYWTVQGWQ